eukprot:Gregarina_sp_Poly_1__10144@NODE_694_length_6726_cov_13_942184_g524_i0_p2_GENE_NODE_694_length_6726_cov_13_942184_g524_i0NODE_694_length_6726_cov_13_942184_g524_i0_p2_ORF_typecomplete_len177_score29_00_NODE_694_length_6726_cov_13_942184_g524_i045085038
MPSYPIHIPVEERQRKQMEDLKRLRFNLEPGTTYLKPPKNLEDELKWLEFQSWFRPPNRLRVTKATPSTVVQTPSSSSLDDGRPTDCLQKPSGRVGTCETVQSNPLGLTSPFGAIRNKFNQFISDLKMLPENLKQADNHWRRAIIFDGQHTGAGLRKNGGYSAPRTNRRPYRICYC